MVLPVLLTFGGTPGHLRYNMKCFWTWNTCLRQDTSKGSWIISPWVQSVEEEAIKEIFEYWNQPIPLLFKLKNHFKQEYIFSVSSVMQFLLSGNGSKSDRYVHFWPKIIICPSLKNPPPFKKCHTYLHKGAFTYDIRFLGRYLGRSSWIWIY